MPWTSWRAPVVSKPSDQRQWYATGSEIRNATVPDQRWANGTHRGVVRRPGRRPYIASAETTWRRASAKTAVASHDFMAPSDGNPRSRMRSPVASWTRP